MRRTSLVAGALGCAAVALGAARAQDLPEGPGRDLVYGQCRTCHDLQYLKESAGIPRDAWDQILISMRDYGLRIAPDQRAKILDYLGTYLGPHPPAAAPAAAQAQAAKADGAAVFKEQCIACHQENGRGVPDQFPPLAGNSDIFLSATYPALVVLYGLEGKIAVGGKSFESQMPPFGHLSDAEIAAVVEYVRSSWGNATHRPAAAKPLTPEAVAATRKAALTPTQVHGRRAELKK